MASVAELEAIGRHTAECAECAAAAKLALSADNSVAALRSAFGAGSELVDHPPESTLHLFADGELDDAEAREVTQHVGSCDLCRGEVEDVRQWSKPVQSRRPRSVAAAAGLLVAGTGIVALMLSLRSPKDAPPSPSAPPRTATAMPAASPAVVRPADWDALVAEVRRTRVLPLPSDIRALATSDTLRGTVPDPAARLFPAGTVVLESRPVFRWPAVENARYRVTLAANETIVAESEILTTPQWQVAAELSPGVVYRWEVEIDEGGNRSIIPAPPAPPAVFRVVEARDMAAIQQARRDAPDDHLLLALLYARAGAVADARRELEALDRSVHDPLAGILLRQIPESGIQSGAPTSTNEAQ